jgi:hypothetical protein
VELYHANQWKRLDVDLVGHCTGEIDISVLKADIQLSPTYALPPSECGIVYGQDVYFLGFPYGMQGDGQLNREFPLPFVKKGILSCMMISLSGPNLLYLDAINNPGFSGGPVVFTEGNNLSYKVAGVVSGYRSASEPIYDGDRAIPLVYRANTGIVVAYGIKHAMEIIQKNPIGFPLVLPE